MNAVAGGGTVLTFPALIFFGMPTIEANATSTFALLVGILGSGYGYRKRFKPMLPLLGRLSAVSIAGGLAGAVLLTFTHEETFANLVPWLLLFATVLFLTNDLFRRLLRLPEVQNMNELAAGPRILFASIFQFLVALYGGYFGAGIGILMLASLAIMGLSNIHDANAVKTVLGALINVVAAAYFVIVDLVIWPQAIVMTIGATIGYFAAAHYSQKIPQNAVRAIAGIIGIGITIILFVRQFGGA